MFPPLRQIAPRFSDWSRAALNFLTVHSGLLICALFLLAGLALAGDYGVNQDERRQREIATVNLNYILGQDPANDPRIRDADRFYGVAFELPLLLAERLPGMDDYHYVHRLRLTLTHLFFIIAAFCCYRLAYHLGGNRLIALLALLLFLLHPRLYAHSYLNSKDLPFLSMFVIALYLLERAFRRDTAGAFLLLGLAVGLLTNLRIAGIMLLPAALAMRGLDLFYAADGPERQGILRTAGLFLLTAGLTFYAVTPYVWANPVAALAASLDLTVNHPVIAVVSVLFQGEWIPSDQLPPHYLPVWFSITTPPLAMLLGLVGIAAVAVKALRRPGAVFRNNRRRFMLLLLAGFLLPPLAAVLLGSDLFNGWRHFYFVYGPFGLLAALGGGWLLAAISRQRRPAAGLYGLAGLGLGLILLQMAQLHPLQYSYFNFLVDRVTPEYLRTQYRMDYWGLAFRNGLEDLLKRHPGEIVVALVEGNHRETLPPAARWRLPRGGGRNADYELTLLDPGKPDLAFNSVYRRFYHNTLIAVRPLDDSLMTPAAVAAYRELYRQAIAGEPISRGDYAAYRDGKRLTFIRENCPADSPEAWLGVKVFPHNPETYPDFRGDRSYVAYGNYRVRLGDTCLAVLQLPDYAQGDLILIQRNAGIPVQWEELYSLSRPGLRELIAQGRRKQPQPDGPDTFDVFLDRAEGRHRLLYAKPHCSQTEYETPVTLHIYPENLTDLPFYLWKGGLDNRDFLLSIYGGRPGGECVAVFPLPDYPIAAIHTGQAGRWAVNLYPPTEPDRLRATYAALSTSPPAARAAFDLYLQDNRLIYLREACAAADTAAGFFLHILPAEVADLPPERQAAGFANLDFAFSRRGGSFDGKCLAAVALPNYPIKEIRTGQYVPDQGELWAVELTVGR